jgi:uroporphyrinogen III methyltransferase/synthase
MKVLVTRAAAQAADLVRELESRGASVVAVPLIEIAPPSSWGALDAALRSLASYRAIAFTSANAVERFFARFYDVLGTCDVAALPAGMRAFAVGPKTAEALAKAGIDAIEVPDESTGDALAQPIARALSHEAEPRILLPRAEDGRDELRGALAKRGFHVDVAPAYRTITPAGAEAALRAALALRIDAITFASPSAVSAFAKLLGKDARSLLAGAKVAVIGPTTADRARELGLAPDVIARKATAASMAEALVR